MTSAGVSTLDSRYARLGRVGSSWRSVCAGTGLSLLSACTAIPGSRDSAAPPDAIITTSLPVSVADAPEAAALRTAPRIALVIGNDRYPNWRSLRLAGADARAIAQNLGARGFTLVGGGAQINISSTQFHQLLDATEAAIRANPGAPCESHPSSGSNPALSSGESAANSV
jgi:hypothetical protein